MSQVPTGYKQTEVGVIPEEWEVQELEKISEVKSGKRLPLGKFLIDKQTSHPYIRVTDMFYGGVKVENIMFVPDDVYPAIKNYRIFKDEIFISVAGTLGIVGKIPDILDGANLTENANKLANILCNRDYLLYFMMSSSIQGRIEAERTLGAQPKLALTRIRKFQIILPTSHEQEAIAEVLSDADALIEATERLIAKKRLIKQGAMQHLITPKPDWEVKKLGEIVKIPITDGPHMTPKFLENGVPFLSVNNLVDNKINLGDLRYISKEDDVIFSKKCKPKKGDLLLGKAASVGKIAIVDTDLDFNIWSPIALIRPKDEYAAYFIYYCFQYSDVIKQIEVLTNSSSQGNIGMGDIEKIYLKFPNFSEQTSIAFILSDMDEEISALEAKLAKYRQIKEAMMQNLLTGKVRLV